ncbi:(2Fe-2S)-binding protein [Roseomonas sp. BN140053]|uniref:(2Fe-2S)-binding protein n=1 Tax=Roseomonas sp. BN140053 TaxID=3391898 RepID=UPI0039EB043B
MAVAVKLDVNGTSHRIEVDDPEMPLLYALRDELGMNDPRFGCGLAQCGACTVHVNGTPTRSCVTPISAVEGQPVVTLAGLGTPERPHPIQTAIVEEQALQCGYCINGWVMTAAALLRDKPRATEAEIREGLSGLKCRCGTHLSIIRAVQRVAQAA